MTQHAIYFKPDNHDATAVTTCTCGLNTGRVPARRADAAAREHADAVGLPDTLRQLRDLMCPVV